MGRGGFGRTYFAVDTDRLNNRCVIKQFAPQRQGTQSFLKAVQLFEQEAVRLNDLGEHPQIPHLLAYFEQDKYLYLVQQMVVGRTLFQELATQGPRSEQEIRSLLEDLLPVLQFIHERGVIHRDITPANIIRRKADQRPILIDFGVAKQFSEAVMYEPGTRIGTEGYAPMEQLRSGQAYPSSDLYSLGTTCLHLLTGGKPEDLYSPLEGRWIWQERLGQMGRSINPGLAQILQGMTRDLVSDRYQTAQDVINDLQRLPKLEGSVPGWASSSTSSSLFSRLQPPPISGPGQSTGLSVPTTIMPTEAPDAATNASPPSPSGQAAPPPSPGSRPTTGPPNPPPRISKPQPAPSPPPPPPSSWRAPISKPGSKATGWQAVRTLVGHQSWVVTLAFNPKLPILVSGSLDDTIRVWNWQTGQTLYTLAGHERGVNAVAIGSGGQVLVSCGDDAAVKVWNLGDRSLLHTLKGHLRDATSIAIGSRGFLLASGSEDSSIKIWTLDRGNLTKSLNCPAVVKSIALAANDTLLISGGLDNAIRIWNLHTETTTHVLAGHANTINQIALSPTEELIASASKDRTLRLWDLKTGRLVQCLQGHTQDVKTVAFFPDGQHLLSGSSDGTLRIWHRRGSLEHVINAHSHPIHSVAIHGSGRLLASASTDKTIKLWQWIR